MRILISVAALLATAATQCALFVSAAGAIPSSYSGPSGWYKEIESLPGWEGALPSRILSGYANLTSVKEAMTPPTPTPETPTEMFMHYFMFLAEPEAGPDPLSVPTLVWWNGGPGATSLWGLFVELGPLLTNMESMQQNTMKTGSIPTLGGKRRNRRAPTSNTFTVDANDEKQLRALYKQLKQRYEAEEKAEGTASTQNSEESEEDGDSIPPSLIRNPWAWTKVANILVFENPPPIGFSYCLPQGPSGNATSCGAWNDTRVGITNAETLRIVFDDHLPMFLQNKAQKLHFAGESYAGVFIGETLDWLLKKGTSRFGKVLGALAGVALGDACLGGDVLCGSSQGPYDHLFFMYGHGQASNQMWEDLMGACTEAELHSATQTPACAAAIGTYTAMVGEYYAYHLYDQCEDTPFSATAAAAAAAAAVSGRAMKGSSSAASSPLHRRRMSGGVKAEIVTKAAKLAVTQTKKSRPPPSPIAAAGVGVGDGEKVGAIASSSPVPPFNGYWCDAMVFFEYFDRPDVRAAIHVPLDSAFFNADNGAGMVYYYNSLTVIPPLMALASNSQADINGGEKVRVMWYVGDTDPSINSFAVQRAVVGALKAYTAALGIVQVQDWSQWRMAQEGTKLAAGYVSGWNPAGASAAAGDAFPFLSIVTVRGAGHMVAEYKPLSALTMMECFIRGTALPGSSFLNATKGKQ